MRSIRKRARSLARPLSFSSRCLYVHAHIRIFLGVFFLFFSRSRRAMRAARIECFEPVVVVVVVVVGVPLSIIHSRTRKKKENVKQAIGRGARAQVRIWIETPFLFSFLFTCVYCTARTKASSHSRSIQTPFVYTGERTRSRETLAKSIQFDMITRDFMNSV